MREIMFYSDFPFGYHNREAEERMARFAALGYTVHYVEKLGIRNPRPAHVGSLARRLTGARSSARDAAPPFEVVSPTLIPPRGVPLIDGLNRRWLARQLLPRLEAQGEAILWLRFPTPEIVPLAQGPSFRLVVYEAVDDHRHTPGMTPRLRRVFERAEQAVLAEAGLVFASSQPVASRLARLHPNVVRASAAAVEPAPFAAAGEGPPVPRRAVYAGSLDFRLDTALLAAAARLLPDWTFAIAGPTTPEAEAELERVANVRLLGARPAAEVPALIGEAAVCLMPYRVSDFGDSLFPVKLVEYLASGRPVVSTPIHAARELAPVVALAGDPESFAEAVRRAAADDSPAARAARIAVADEYSWDRRIDQMQRAVEEALERA
jgi:UDP-galactopyranose mutase